MRMAIMRMRMRVMMVTTMTRIIKTKVMIMGSCYPGVNCSIQMKSTQALVQYKLNSVVAY